MDLNEELEIRRARIKKLGTDEYIAKLNRRADIESDFWSRMERLIDPGPSPRERLQAEVFDQGEAVVEVIEAQHREQETEVLKGQWEGRLE